MGTEKKSPFKSALAIRKTVYTPRNLTQQFDTERLRRFVRSSNGVCARPSKETKVDQTTSAALKSKQPTPGTVLEVISTQHNILPVSLTHSRYQSKKALPFL